MKDRDILEKELGKLNKHLPQSRKSLSKLLKMDKPEIKNRDGSKQRLKKKELNFLSEALPREDHPKLKLPIIIRLSPQLGKGAAKISGKIERKILRKILNKEEKEEKEMVIYRPEVRKIRKKIPTTTQYAFMISSRGGSVDRTR